MNKAIFKQALHSRTIVGLWILQLIQAAGLIILVLTHISVGDLQVPISYSEFSTASFFTGHWYYLLNFIAFAVVVLAANVLLSLKLLQIKSRGWALGWLLVGVAVLAVAGVILAALLKITGLV
jgi:hypothetical protein